MQKRQACLDVMPRAAISYVKMQQVSAEMSSLLGCYAERSDILCKDTPIHDEFKIIEIILFSMGFIF
ncbi:hypothetical protein [Xylanibacter rarus]|uniref:hypothetical protein n=2 Tax=Prevotellaceae TaxID=171552 RepID=UPI0011C7B325|nr:hypothetical protein [Xylanibacter rarus]